MCCSYRVLRFRDISLSTGVNLHFAEQGAAKDLPAALLLHAIGDSWFSFQPLLAQLSPEVCHVIALDQRGHGQSQVTASSFEVEDFALDAVALLDELGIESVVVVASSSASFTGRLLARRFPDRVRGLLLLGGPGVCLDSDAARLFVDEMNVWVENEPVPRSWVANLVAAMTASPMPPEFTQAMITDSCRVPVRVWRRTLAGLLSFDDRTDLAGITTRTVVVRGELDNFIEAAAAEELASLIPKSRLLTYPGVGHVPHWDRPDLVAADLRSLLT